MKNFKEIPQLTSEIFSELIEGNTFKYNSALKIKKDLETNNQQLAELFWIEFSYEFNKFQSNLFFEKNTIININSEIKKTPSIWLTNWAHNTSNLIEKYSIDKDFEIRRHDFHYFSEDLSKILNVLEYIFEKTTKDLNIFYEMKDDVVDNFYFSAPTKEIQKNGYLNFLYYTSCLVFFKDELKNDDEKISEISKFIIDYYYGKHLDKNKILFNTWGQEKEFDKQIKHKLESLSFKQEDPYYWNFFQNNIRQDIFLNQMKSSFDFSSYSKTKKESLSFVAYTKNNYELLHIQLDKKDIKEPIKKNIKI